MNKVTRALALACGFSCLSAGVFAQSAYPLESVRGCVKAILEHKDSVTRPEVAATYCACLDREMNARVALGEPQAKDPATRKKVQQALDEASPICQKIANGS